LQYKSPFSMSQPPAYLIPNQAYEPDAEPECTILLADVEHAATLLHEPEAMPGILHKLHTPRVLFGQVFTLRQVVFGLLLVFCLTPWASPPLA
jgi:hypothetical protein